MDRIKTKPSSILSIWFIHVTAAQFFLSGRIARSLYWNRGGFMSALNPQPPVVEPTQPGRLPIGQQKDAAQLPAWVEFALQEALRATGDDVPTDLAQRHDEYALGHDDQP
jgi:hypothetical protein